MGRSNSRTAPAGALIFFHFEHVAHVDEADNLIDILLEDGNARILLGDDELAQLFERRVGGDGDDVGTRRHHFAHHLIAEFDHGLDQLAVVFFDQSLFGAGADERLDVFRRGRRLLVGRLVVCEIDQRLEELEERLAGQGNPAPARATAGRAAAASRPEVRR